MVILGRDHLETSAQISREIHEGKMPPKSHFTARYGRGGPTFSAA